MKDQICITNSTDSGLGTLEYMDTLLLFNDILCIQEHFLLVSKDRQDWSQKCSAWKDFWDIADMDKCPQDKCCLDKCRGDICNLLYMFPGPFV